MKTKLLEYLNKTLEGMTNYKKAIDEQVAKQEETFKLEMTKAKDASSSLGKQIEEIKLIIKWIETLKSR